MGHGLHQSEANVCWMWTGCCRCNKGNVKSWTCLWGREGRLGRTAGMLHGLSHVERWCGQKGPHQKSDLVQILALPPLTFLSLSFFIYKNEDEITSVLWPTVLGITEYCPRRGWNLHSILIIMKATEKYFWKIWGCKWWFGFTSTSQESQNSELGKGGLIISYKHLILQTSILFYIWSLFASCKDPGTNEVIREYLGDRTEFIPLLQL